jgi:hypothetical protein
MPIDPDTSDRPRVPIIIANAHYGDSGGPDNVATYTETVRIQYAEFMQRMYSSSGVFAFSSGLLGLGDILLQQSNNLTPEVVSEVIRANYSVSFDNVLTSAQLHDAINGAFLAEIRVSCWSRILQCGIDVKYVFDVVSAPRKPSLTQCIGHIYQIVDLPFSNCHI